jgi:DNA polymerase III sliding clamp (beta) subunit (PCNA family)
LYSLTGKGFRNGKNAIVPVRALQAFAHGIKGLYSIIDVVRMYISEERIQLHYGDFRLDSTLIKSLYPGYQNVIHTETPYVAILGRKKLCEAVKRLLAYADKDTPRIGFTFEAGSATLSAENSLYNITGTESVPCDCKGEAFNVSLNGERLLSILESTKEERIAMRMAGGASPAIVEPYPQAPPAHVLHLIVPSLEANS